MDQAEDTQAAPERQNLPGTVMVNVVSSINRSVQYTEGLEYSRAAQGKLPCALHPAPYTLHPVPCALRSVTCALRPVPCDLCPAPCSLRPVLCVLHPVPC